MRDIKISPAFNGFIVKAGCQLLVYQDRSQMKQDICSYIDDPDFAEKMLLERWGQTGTYRNIPHQISNPVCDNSVPDCAPTPDIVPGSLRASNSTGIGESLMPQG